MLQLAERIGSAKAVQNRSILMTRRPRNYRIFAIVLCAFFAWSLPGQAAPKPRAIVRHSFAARHRVSAFVDSSKDDVTEFDDPVVRKAAIEALGRYNGSVVAIEPSTGRILAIVNQKLVF